MQHAAKIRENLPHYRRACAKGSHPLDILSGMHVSFFLISSPPVADDDRMYNLYSNLHTGHPSPGRMHSSRLFWHRVAGLGEVGRPWLKFGHAKRGQG